MCGTTKSLNRTLFAYPTVDNQGPNTIQLTIYGIHEDIMKNYAKFHYFCGLWVLAGCSCAIYICKYHRIQ